MLDAFIIEELKRRERSRKEDERPWLKLPVADNGEEREEVSPEEESDRGVVVLDM